MAINPKGVGHVVLKVRDLDRSARFYREVIGLKEVARYRGRMVFFSATGANHHDLALLEVGAQASAPAPDAVGLYHVALKIGDRIDDLRAAKAHLEAHGITPLRLADHRVSKSIYLTDPDGNGLELFVDTDPAIWRENPAAVATVGPLEL
ncbi:MAG: glyoxalase [Candidatus Rokuibacteriota bacterium]|jgi:catechol 2,3-dioxygenase|nr:MAG: glyoxalase [Candidatus Rokubacteria bacterium]